MNVKNVVWFGFLFLVIGCVSVHAAGIADFDGSVAGEDHSATNLNAGSAGGSWTVIQSGGVASEGFSAVTKIELFSDTVDNNQFQIDGPRLDKTGGLRETPFDLKLDLTMAVALNGSNTLSFDAAVRRAGAGASSQRDGLIIGYDADGDILFELVIDGVDAANRGTIGLVGQTPSSEKINFVNPNSAIATTDMKNISIVLGAATFDVIVDGVTAYSGISYTDTVTDLSGIQFTASGVDAGYAGYSIDNVEIKIQASNPDPADGATGEDPADLNTNGLCWDVPADASVTGSWLYVRVGDPNLAVVTPEFVSGTSGQVCQVPASVTFANDQLIYWRVDSQINNSGPLPGDPNTQMGMLWSFETIKSVPVIVNQPQDVAQFPATGDAGFVCDFTSLTVPTVDWLKDGSSFSSGSLVNNGGDSYTATLTISSADVADEGTYACEITNGGGMETSEDADLLIKRRTAYWKFDGNFIDQMGNFDLGNSDPNDYPNFTSGLLSDAGQAIDPNGSGQFVDVTPAEPLNYFAGYTFTLWTQTDNTNQAYTGIVASGSGGFQIDVLNSNFRYAAQGSPATNFGPVTAGQRAFLALSFDGSQAMLYMDGLAVGGPISQAASLQILNKIQVGVNRGDNIFYEGIIDDVQLYNYALSQADIVDIQYAETATPVCDLALSNQFDVAGPGGATPDCLVDLYDFAAFAVQWLDCVILPASECL